MAEERKWASRPENTSLHESALDLAYRKGLARGMDETAFWPSGRIRDEIRRWLTFEATLVIGLAPTPDKEDEIARLGLLIRLEDIAGRIDGLTTTLMKRGTDD